MPFFSVVIPLYNKAEYISTCVDSILNQSFDDFEIIIVNDGSTDNGLDIIGNYSLDKITIYNQENSGVSIARNNGVKNARGEFIAFLDADDNWRTNHLSELRKSIQTFPNAGLYCNNYEINFNGNYIKPARFNFKFSSEPILLNDFFEASFIDTVVWTSATAISREKFLNFGMFNPIYTTGQDLDLWIRIALKEPIVFNPKITMLYNKSIIDSLSKSENNEARFTLLSSFQAYEDENLSLRRYLDLKRYGLALRTKINGENAIYKNTLELIDFKNLSFKQKVLLKTPRFVLRKLNIIRPKVISSKLYLLLFKR